jgi:hypothetical protein
MPIVAKGAAGGGEWAGLLAKAGQRRRLERENQ